MRCKYCGANDSKVLDSRPTGDGMEIRRRRECVKCLRRFTTYERHVLLSPMVVKRDGRREPFDPEKIRRGVLRACEKRPIPQSDVDTLVNDVEMEVNNSLLEEVSSEAIGEMVMTRLKYMDEVAYVRFASVYRQFRDISTFMDELEEMLNESSAPKRRGREQHAE